MITYTFTVPGGQPEKKIEAMSLKNPQSFYDRNKKEIWKIINNEGGLIDFLKYDGDTQYIEDHDSLKSVLSWLAVEYVAQKMRESEEE